MMRWCLVAFVLVAIAPPAAAQSTYVGASLVGDLARFSRIEVDYPPGVPRPQWPDDASALGFNVRLGRALGERWGLELEFARSGKMEAHVEYSVPLTIGVFPELPPPFGMANFDVRIDREQQHTGFGALAWFRQDLGERVDLSYLGGIVFSRWRTAQSQEVSALWLSIFPPPASTTVTYDITPAIGVEAAVKVTERAAVTTGVRLQGIAGGWLLRPNAGFRWTF